LVLGFISLFSKDSKPEEDTLRKEHRDFSFSYGDKDYMLKDSKVLFSIDSKENKQFIHYFVEFPGDNYFGIKFNDSGGEADVTSYALKEIRKILDKKLEISRWGLINGVV
jgi:hypothetical protein